jgi:hypothetical protein
VAQYPSQSFTLIEIFSIRHEAVAVAGRNLMNTGNEVFLSPTAICFSASGSVPEGILLTIQRFFRPLSPSYHEMFVTLSYILRP